MKKTALQVSAVVIGVFVFIVIFNFLNGHLPVGMRLTGERFFWEKHAAVKVGMISEVAGLVERRPTGSVRFEKVAAPSLLRNQDLLMTQNASTANLEIQPGDGSMPLKFRLDENSKIVIELDSAHPGRFLGTLLAGSVHLLQTASGPQALEFFTLIREGRPISFAESDSHPIPTLKNTETEIPVDSASGSTGDVSLGLSITATREADRGQNTTGETTTPADDAEVNSDVLSNADIVRQLRKQSSYFQRCYLSYLHRREEKSLPGLEAGGQVTVKFTVESSGKITDSTVIKSEFADITLNNCISEVINRTVFRNFRGKPVPVLEFPIQLK